MMVDEPPTVQQLIQEMRVRNRDELARGHARMLELGEPPERIRFLLHHAEIMLNEQIACVERMTGLAPPESVQ